MWIGTIGMLALLGCNVMIPEVWYVFPIRDALICLTTNDVAPEDVANELLSAEVEGQAVVEGFVNDRLIDKTTDFYSTLKLNKTKTLAPICKVKVATGGGKKMKWSMQIYLSRTQGYITA